MRKPAKVLSVVVVFITGLVAFSWPWIKMILAGSAHYSEQDRREYNFYTPEVLKKMPRISPRYNFVFANITGPAKHVYAIEFYGTEDIDKIERYLAALGYMRQGNFDIDKLCWQSKDASETISITTMKSEKGVVVQYIIDFS
ncbi:hypothetical protein [Enterobacter sp. Bisph1]|uniref:hypothetical protein n=1 Tax=Enterobacter sp. Bisph1 TaxID=1274399 RepID=UPI00057C0CA7|nr:hypothetical protein [Enterobacter sp. Bisph1]